MRFTRAVAIAVPFAVLAACGSADSTSVPADSDAPIVGDSAPDSADLMDPPEDPEPEIEGLSLRYGSLTERSIDIDANGENTTAAVAGMNEFAVDLYSSVSASSDEANVVVSPYSVTFALGMIYAGARGDTAAEMADVLHADGMDVGDWQEGINAYDLSLDARTSGTDTDWASGNKVWTRPGLPLLDDYLDVLTGVYDSPLAEADFAADPDAQRQVINRWADAETNDLIPELFPAGSIDSSTAMVLVNAIALDAPWQFPFDPAATFDRDFTTADGATVTVPTMHYDEFLPTAIGDGYSAVELPYDGGALSMVVIVPDDFATFEENMTAESLDAVFGSISDGGIHLALPTWTARTHVNLNESLSDLGMPTAFSGGADFSGMVEGGGGLSLSTVEHEAFVEVDEEGTTAAAATGGAMAASHGPTIDVLQPFVYVIRDQGAGTILFIGSVTDPSIAAG